MINKNGGGVFITIHDRFKTNAVESGDNKCELAWAEVQTNAKSVNIGSFYRPPNSTPEALQELRTSIEKVKQKSKIKPIILAGDFNLPHIDWDNNTVKPGAYLIYQHHSLS
jgi:exonuclease III